ncbi:MAG: hypothetical protein H7Y43_16715 [Akkermansiaceae bacterium]|nr:hypothetical protein [Verrucomicrobiales bacterium]
MIIGRSRFNIYLICTLLAVTVGCQSPEKKQARKKEKQVSTLAIHLEAVQDSMDFSRSIQIFREKPLVVNIDKAAFLTESEVAEAKIVPERDGWSLLIKFNQRGTWLLEQYTTTNPGRHMAIFSTFGEDKKEARWLSAPLIHKRISNGILTFTPDATREESEQLVFGLNNLVKQAAAKSKW